MKKLLVTFVIPLFLTSFSFAQGQLFNKEEADELFGEVVESVEVSSTLVADLFTKAQEKIMFRVIDGKFQALDEMRNPIYPKKLAVSDDEVFHMFDVKIGKELLEKGNTLVTVMQNRKEKFTMTNGNITLERTAPCPPHCFRIETATK